MQYTKIDIFCLLPFQITYYIKQAKKKQLLAVNAISKQ